MAGRSDLKPTHPYAGSLLVAFRAGAMALRGGRSDCDAPATGEEVKSFLAARLGKAPESVPEHLTHGEFFLLAGELL